jgi:hypothetical protein
MDDKFVRLNLRREHFPKFAGLKLPHDLTVAVKASGVTRAILNDAGWVEIFGFLEPRLLIQGRGADSRPSPDRAA